MRSALADAFRPPLGWEPWRGNGPAGVCGGFGQVPAARPRSCTHDVPAPSRPWHQRFEDSVAKVWSFEEWPPVLRLCGAAAESSALKKKSTAPNVMRLVFSFMSTFVFFSFTLNLASVMYRGDILDKGPCFRLVRCAAAGARRVYCVVGPPHAC